MCHSLLSVFHISKRMRSVLFSAAAVLAAAELAAGNAPHAFPRGVLLVPPGAGPGHPAGLSVVDGTLPMNATTTLNTHVATIANPVGHWKVFCPGCGGANTCVGYGEHVSTQAKAHGCQWATNGGPFGMLDWACMGPMVSNGVVVHNASSSNSDACFGLVYVPNNPAPTQIFMGDINADNWDAYVPAAQELFCGFHWLVFDGVVQPSAAPLVAPRTIIGTDAQNRVVNAVVDGSEKARTGLTLNETAAWAAHTLGLRYAVNLDGGGSSTVWYDGAVRGCPTCIDVPWCCERSVVTISCVVP